MSAKKLEKPTEKHSRVETSPTSTNTENYKTIRVKARHTIKTTQHQSWHTYVLSKINSKTPIKNVWSMIPMIHKISSKPTGTKIPHLHVNNNEVTDIPDIANSLAQTFSDNSSSKQYSTKFQSFSHQAENNPLNFKSNNTKTYNISFIRASTLTHVVTIILLDTRDSFDCMILSQ